MNVLESRALFYAIGFVFNCVRSTELVNVGKRIVPLLMRFPHDLAHLDAVFYRKILVLWNKNYSDAVEAKSSRLGNAEFKLQSES